MAAPQVVDGTSDGAVTAVVGAGKALAGGGVAPGPQQVAPDAPPPAAAGPPKPDAMKIHQMKKRIAVAAEAISNAADIEVPVVPKTDYAERLIGARMRAARCARADRCLRPRADQQRDGRSRGTAAAARRGSNAASGLEATLCIPPCCPGAFESPHPVP